MKLTKDELKQRDEHVARLQERRDAVEKAQEAFNAALAEKWPAVEAALAAYNEAIDDARLWATEEVAGRLREAFDEKGERWQEGEKGQALSELADQPEELNLLDEDARAEDLEGLTTETSS